MVGYCVPYILFFLLIDNDILLLHFKAHFRRLFHYTLTDDVCPDYSTIAKGTYVVDQTSSTCVASITTKANTLTLSELPDWAITRAHWPTLPYARAVTWSLGEHLSQTNVSCTLFVLETIYIYSLYIYTHRPVYILTAARSTPGLYRIVFL